MRMLIIRAGAMGDTLMLMPLIRALPKEYQINILGRRPGIDYLEPYVKQCIDMERGGWHGIFARECDIHILRPPADHVIAFINDTENIVSENLGRLYPEAKIDIFPPFPVPGSRIHVVIHMAKALQSAGIAVSARETFNAALQEPVMEANEGKGKMILLHPGSGSKKKNYPPDFWFKLLIHIKNNSDPSAGAGFLLGPAEEDMVPAVREKAEEFKAEVYICPGKNELLSILGDTHLFIGHDSGVTHLAAMLGINTAVLFKGSPVHQWRPLGPGVRIIEEDTNSESVLKKTLTEVLSIPRGKT